MLRRAFVGFAAMLALAGIASVGAPVQAAGRSLAHPSISVSTSGSGLGAVFTVTGSGFGPGSTVIIQVSNADGTKATVNQSAEQNGTLRAVLPALSLNIPVDTGRSITFQTIGFQVSNPYTVVYP